MSSLVSRRARAATASLLLASVALSGCSILGGARNSTDISKLPNIPEGQKQQLISQMQSASGSEKREIAAKATALSKMVGTGWSRWIPRRSSTRPSSWIPRVRPW